MVKVGQKVLFIPHFMELQGNNSKAIKQEPVIATVFMVNPSREMFFVRWKVNGVTLRQGLQYFDLYKPEKRVQVLRTNHPKGRKQGDTYG